MPKRKREDDIGEAVTRARNELHHAFKTAKGFERQRQSKRLHDAKVPADKKARIEKEVVVLKSLDLHQAAHAHLCSALLRVKSVAESPKLPAEIKAGIPKPELTEDERIALHNVTSGLANRQEVRGATDNAIAAVCKALGVPVPDKRGRGKKGDSTGKPEKGKAETESRENKKPEKDQTKKLEEDDSDLAQEEKAISQLDDLLASSSGEEDSEAEGEEEAGKRSRAKPKPTTSYLDPMEITDDEADGIDDEDITDDLDPNEVTSDESDADPESEAESSESEFQGFSDAVSHSSEEVPGDDDDDDDQSGSDSDSDSDSDAISRPPNKKQKAAAPIKTSGSTFLPTLMGGYISGSESEASDIDIAPSTHKNRRGQRARQAIWEKRYKAEARHLKKQQQQQKQGGRDAGWDPKRGAVDGENKPWKRGIRNPFERGNGGDGDSGSAGGGGNSGRDGMAPQKAPPPRKRDDTGPLHPSWEAKRKAKEAQSASAPFQGKKIVFE
ncbi:Bud-site selection protein [Echria macrotheca]|uniref:Bud-site selection protein n=1 Tax=Echria macrotheca TaxID=438768 RepID=A0AAJ0BKA7_9PEZI|nr:Bud-site selection protein [Echria macrotheca]